MAQKTHCNRCDMVMNSQETAASKDGLRISKWRRGFFEDGACEEFFDLCPKCKKALVEFMKNQGGGVAAKKGTPGLCGECIYLSGWPLGNMKSPYCRLFLDVYEDDGYQLLQPHGSGVLRCDQCITEHGYTAPE